MNLDLYIHYTLRLFPPQLLKGQNQRKLKQETDMNVGKGLAVGVRMRDIRESGVLW